MQEKAQGLEKSVEQWDDASRAETGSSGDDVMTDEIAHAVEADQEAYAALTHKMESVDAAKPGRPPSDGDIASGVEEADRVAEKMREQGVGGGASSGDAGTGASATAVESALAATVDAMVAEVGEGPAPTLPSARAIDAVSKVHMHPFVSFSPPKQRRPCVSFTDPVSERCKRASTLRECFGASYAANRTALVNCTGLTSDDDILLIWKVRLRWWKRACPGPLPSHAHPHLRRRLGMPRETPAPSCARTATTARKTPRWWRACVTTRSCARETRS